MPRRISYTSTVKRRRTKGNENVKCAVCGPGVVSMHSFILFLLPASVFYLKRAPTFLDCNMLQLEDNEQES